MKLFELHKWDKGNVYRKKQIEMLNNLLTALYIVILSVTTCNDLHTDRCIGPLTACVSLIRETISTVDKSSMFELF